MTTELLFDAAVIAHGTDAAAPLIAELHRRSLPLSTTLGELAARYDVPAADALEACVAAGVKVFWLDGMPVGPETAKARLLNDRTWTPAEMAGQVEIDLTEEQANRLEDMWG